MKLQLSTIAKILAVTCLFFGFKFSSVYKGNEAAIKSNEKKLSLIKVDRANADKNLALANTLKVSGKGSEIVTDLPSTVNGIVRDMELYGITGKITPDADGVNVTLTPISATMGTSKYARLTIAGTYSDYSAFKKFISDIKSSGMSINKISISERLEFSMVVDMVGF